MDGHKKFATALAAALLVILSYAATAHAYEFHLLGGMVIKGDLKSFSSGVFYVDTEFGETAINAANLDYIIVEPNDAAGPRGVHEGMLEFGLPGKPTDNKSEEWAPEKVEAPEALSGHSIPSGRKNPTGALSGGAGVTPPKPLGSWSVVGNKTVPGYPGVFHGSEEAVPPKSLGSWSVVSVKTVPEHPGLFRGNGDAGETMETPAPSRGRTDGVTLKSGAVVVSEPASVTYTTGPEPQDVPAPISGHTLEPSRTTGETAPGQPKW